MIFNRTEGYRSFHNYAYCNIDERSGGLYKLAYYSNQRSMSLSSELPIQHACQAVLPYLSARDNSLTLGV